MPYKLKNGQAQESQAAFFLVHGVGELIKGLENERLTCEQGGRRHCRKNRTVQSGSCGLSDAIPVIIDSLS